VISRASSIRVETESRIDRVDEELTCIRAPRVRSNAASGASIGGALESGSCESEAKFSIQRTEMMSWNTW
jgi:hypothetical protein